MNSILISVKKMLGIADEDTSFDVDLIISINTVFGILTQMGVGNSSGFSISDRNAVWTDYILSTDKLSFVKSYVFMKVKLLFDPPTNSSVSESMNRLLSEIEWRISHQVDENRSESLGGD